MHRLMKWANTSTKNDGKRKYFVCLQILETMVLLRAFYSTCKRPLFEKWRQTMRENNDIADFEFRDAQSSLLSLLATRLSS